MNSKKAIILENGMFKTLAENQVLDRAVSRKLIGGTEVFCVPSNFVLVTGDIFEINDEAVLELDGDIRVV